MPAAVAGADLSGRRQDGEGRRHNPKKKAVEPAASRILASS